jgi:cytochrome c5
LQQTESSLFDAFTFAIGLFLGTVAAIAASLTARSISHNEPMAAEDEAAAHALVERIEPIGQVVMLGDAALAAAAAPPPAPARVDTVLSGPQVFNEACYLCHSPPGVPGAPVIGSRADWEPRIEKGLPVLQEHALNGFQGEAGFMPAKGGRVDLSDQEVLSAIDYMISQVEGEGSPAAE